MEKETYELTYPQKNIWFVDKFNDNTAVNTIAGSIYINKDFDVDICKKAINEFIRINDATRMRIIMDGETPKQYVEEYIYQDIDILDFTDKTEKEADEFEEKISKEYIKLMNSNLVYFTIIKLPNNKGKIYAKLHHMVCDAWSISLLVTEISEIYDNIKYNKGLDLSENKPSYIDYILSEKEYINSEKMKKDEEFFREYLAECPRPIDIKSGKIISELSAKRYTKYLDKNINETINEFCKENKISPYVLFFTALAIYIERINDTSDFILGTPILNRSNFKEKQMVGMFVSTIPVRFKIDEKNTFLNICQEFTRDNMSIFRHQKYPYSKTLQYIRETTDIKENLYHIVLSYQNARSKTDDLIGQYHAKWDFSGYQQQSLAVHIMDINNDGLLQINYDYLTCLFDDIEIEFLHTRIMTIINNAINDVNVDIEDIEIMSVKEKKLILNEFNNTKMDYPYNKSVIQLFEEQVKKEPDNIALIFEEKEITYRELNEKIEQFSAQLRVLKNENIIVCLNNTESLIIAIYAILKSGNTYIPINPSTPIERINSIIVDCEAKHAVTDIPLSNVENIIMLEENINKENLKYDNLPEDIAYIIYTSGSTGKPKGVKISNKSLMNYICWAKKQYVLEGILPIMPLYSSIGFDLTVTTIFLPLISRWNYKNI